MEFSNRIPSPEQYNNLRHTSGMSMRDHDPERIVRALQNSAFIVSVWENDELIGFGRVIDDGGICYSVNDIMVDKDYQRRGIGDQIMTKIDEYLDAHADTNSFVTLLARIPADHIYARHKFEYIDPKRRYGMIRHQDDRPDLPFSPM